MLLVAVTAASCTVQETEAPDFAGPSEMALALHLQALPDQLTQDGQSQSIIQIDALGPSGQPVRSLAVKVDILANGVLVDFGTLSAKTVVTGDDGRARVTYTAPPKPAESVGFGTLVTILATPLNGDFRAALARQVDIRLMPPGVVLPPNGAPVPSFLVNPSPIVTFTLIGFDASNTTDEGVPCGARCTYVWNFGDGVGGTGMITTHEYRVPGSYIVRLTVTDDRGLSTSITQTVVVTAAAPPTASFVFSPTAPLPGDMIFFNASASRAAPGRQIVFYEWDFGSGRTGEGVTIAKGYNTPGTYAVTLKVTDDANQVGTVTQNVPVGVVVEESSSSSFGRRPPP
jgi:hypothetical protein